MQDRVVNHHQGLLPDRNWPFESTEQRIIVAEVTHEDLSQLRFFFYQPD
jgi:hypothetical protein